MEIRRAQPSEAKAIVGIILPVFREGSTYTIDPDISEADALAYWVSSDRDTFVADDDGSIVGTYYLRANQAGGGRHVCNCGYITDAREFNSRTGIVIGLPMTTASYNETNPFAIRFVGAKGVLSYILGHQPMSFDWRARTAKPHPSKQVSEAVFALACETLNQIIDIG
jgi:mRNA interferase MazF